MFATRRGDEKISAVVERSFSADSAHGVVALARLYGSRHAL